MTFQQIKYVVEIANCGSISRAAESQYVAQAYLSACLRSLEEELHIRIFHRSRRGVELTEQGKEFISYARPLLMQYDQMQEIYAQDQSERVFRLTVSTQRYPFIIKSFIDYFRQIDPKRYEIHLREENMYRVIDDVCTNRSDIGIIFISRSNEPFIKKHLAVKGVEFNTIATVNAKVFFREDHPMASREEVTLEEMARYPFASFEADSSLSDNFSEEVYIQRFNRNQNHIYVIDRATMMNVLRHTDAFSIGTGILSEGFAGPQLVSRPIANFDRDVQIGWLNVRGRSVPAAVDGLIEKIQRTLEDV